MEKLYVELIDIALDHFRKMDTSNEDPHFYTDGTEIYLFQGRGYERITINEVKRRFAIQIHSALSLTPNKIALYECRDESMISFENAVNYDDEPIEDICEYKEDILGTTLYYLYD